MGLTMNDYNALAQELGWNSYFDACQQIADRLGFATFEDLTHEIECAPGGFDLLSDLTDEEYELWSFDL